MNDEMLRAEVVAWLGKNWDAAEKRPKENPQAGLQHWLGIVLEARWSAPNWPLAWYGRGLSEEQAKLIAQEFARVGAPGACQDRTHIMTYIAAHTLLSHGKDSLKQRLLPQLLKGECSVCLLFSEPGAGSDLASVRTRAESRGDCWIINGQKAWSSGAHKAEFGLLIARTNWDVPKHQGMSFFVLPMRQHGVDVRPIHQITDDSHFNEVFLTEAIVPMENLVGNENEGWRILLTALTYEREMIAEGWGDWGRGSVKEDDPFALVSLARDCGRLEDPLVRQQVAQAVAYRHLKALNLARAKAETAAGLSSSVKSVGKLAASRVLHTEAHVMTAILGADSMLDGPDHAVAASVNYRTLNAYMTSIGGGTDQIQRNMIAERVLGLRREIEDDRAIPFRQSRALGK